MRSTASACRPRPRWGRSCPSRWHARKFANVLHVRHGGAPAARARLPDLLMRSRHPIAQPLPHLVEEVGGQGAW
eukprot:5704225-Lingulodinium_polyedra.AAC.1